MNELTSEVVRKPVNATVWVAPEKKLTGIQLYYTSYLSIFFYTTFPFGSSPPIRWNSAELGQVACYQPSRGLEMLLRTV